MERIERFEPVLLMVPAVQTVQAVQTVRIAARRGLDTDG